MWGFHSIGFKLIKNPSNSRSEVNDRVVVIHGFKSLIGGSPK